MTCGLGIPSREGAEVRHGRRRNPWTPTLHLRHPHSSSATALGLGIPVQPRHPCSTSQSSLGLDVQPVLVEALRVGVPSSRPTRGDPFTVRSPAGQGPVTTAAYLDDGAARLPRMDRPGFPSRRKNVREHEEAGYASRAVHRFRAGLTGCASNNPTSGAPAASGAAGALSGSISGAGASSQEQAMTAWSTGFKAVSPASPSVQPVGSGSGRKNFLAGQVAFAGSDAALKTDEYEASKAVRPAGCVQHPGLRVADRDRLQPQGRQGPQAGRRHRGQDLQGHHHHLERSGDRRPQRGRHAAGHEDHRRAPLGRLGHHRELHRLPRPGRLHRLDGRQGAEVADRRPGVRSGHQRRRQADHRHGRGRRLRGRVRGRRTRHRAGQGRGRLRRPVRRWAPRPSS